MNRFTLSNARPPLYALLPCAVSTLLAGCAGVTGTDAVTRPSNGSPVRLFAEPTRSGAEVWRANCNRCHNAPPPTTFRPDEWDLVLQHMRLRANLTGGEVRAVAGFLKGEG